MERILEPEVMDDREEAIEYDAMDFTEVNTNFAKEAVQLAGINARNLPGQWCSAPYLQAKRFTRDKHTSLSCHTIIYIFICKAD